MVDKQTVSAIDTFNRDELQTVTNQNNAVKNQIFWSCYLKKREHSYSTH